LRPYKDFRKQHTNPEDTPEQQNLEVAPIQRRRIFSLSDGDAGEVGDI